MFRTRRPASLGTLSALIALVALVTLARPARPAVFGIEIAGGFNTYALGAVNDSLHLFNDSLGTNFPDITGGAGGLIALRVWPNDRLLLRFAIEPMLAESENTQFGTLTYDTGPVATTVTGTWFFNPPQTWRFGLGAGLGWYSIVGELKGPGGSVDLTGDGLGVHGQGEILLELSPRWSLGAQLGYRYAKVNDTKVQDLSTSPALVSDFSGMLFRIGAAYDWWPSR